MAIQWSRRNERALRENETVINFNFKSKIYFDSKSFFFSESPSTSDGKRPSKILVRREIKQEDGAVGGISHADVTVQLTMPNVASMLNVLRIAKNEIAGLALDNKDNSDSERYEEYRNHISNQEGKLLDYDQMWEEGET